MKHLFTTLALSAAVLSPAVAQEQLPPRIEILQQMEKVNDWFMAKHPDPTAQSFGKGKYRPSSLWTRGVYYEGLMALYSIHPLQKYYDYTYQWCDFHKWTPRNGAATRDADDYCCAQTYIDMYRLEPESRKLTSTIANCDMYCNTPDVSDWWWIDAIQMGMPVFAKLGKTLDEPKYWDKAHEMYMYTRDKFDGGLWNAQDGLWWRDMDFNPPYKTPQKKQCYWSRGNGWVVAALVRVMDELPVNHPYYYQYKADLIAMCESLRGRIREDGTWNCSLDDPKDFGGMEVTGTSLFIYGMAYGVRKGFLDANVYMPVITKAWNAMSKHAVHEDGFLGFQQGTGKEPKESQPTLYDKLPDFDDFGIGCFLLCGSEVYKLSPGEQGSGAKKLAAQVETIAKKK